jgi:hypothetical protein
MQDGWSWFYFPAESKIYHKEGQAFQVYSRNAYSRSCRLSARFKPITKLEWSLPPDYELAPITTLPNKHIQLTGTHQRPTVPTVPNPDYTTMTIQEILAQQNALDRWAVLDISVVDQGLILAQGILAGEVMAVSDGSFKDQYGTSGFVLQGSNRQLGAIGVNAVPGNQDEHSSYRSELAGISGSLAIITATCLKYNIFQGQITLLLDGIEALR